MSLLAGIKEQNGERLFPDDGLCDVTRPDRLEVTYTSVWKMGGNGKTVITAITKIFYPTGNTFGTCKTLHTSSIQASNKTVNAKCPFLLLLKTRSLGPSQLLYLPFPLKINLNPHPTPVTWLTGSSCPRLEAEILNLPKKKPRPRSRVTFFGIRRPAGRHQISQASTTTPSFF